MSDLSDQEIDVLARVHRAVSTAPGGPLVVVGGWAARLLRRHPLAAPSNFEPLSTEDLDIAAPDRVPKKTDRLGEQLKKEGFSPDYRSEDRPPVTRYVLKSANDFELEFIAPLRGGEVRRDGTLDATADVLGVSAQKLRHVELLLLEPYPIELPELGSGATLLVANPASFIIQRLLILPSRPSLSKKGKDALYIHDVLQLFTDKGRIHPDIVAQAGRVLATLTKKQGQRTRETVADLGDPTAGSVKEAARIAAETPRPSPPSATAIGVACRLGLAELLG